MKQSISTRKTRKGRPKGSKNRTKILKELKEDSEGILLKGTRIFSEENDSYENEDYTNELLSKYNL